MLSGHEFLEGAGPVDSILPVAKGPGIHFLELL